MKIEKSDVKLFLSVCFKGISQVLLIENSISGFIIFLAISIYSLPMGVMAFLSATIGAIFGKLAGIDEKIVEKGLMGYNSVLTGISLMLLLTGPDRWVIALVGAVVAAIFTVAFMYVMKDTKMPILTFPFILLVWLILSASFKLKSFKISPILLPQNIPDFTNITVEVEIIDSIFNGVGQIYFLHDTNISGLLIFIAIFWAGWKIGLYSLLGNAAAILFAHILGAEHPLMILGFYGYNAILTIVAVTFYYNNDQSWKTAFWGFSAACMTVPLTASVDALLEPYDLPVLTMPFVLSTWIFLCAKKMMIWNR